MSEKRLAVYEASVEDYVDSMENKSRKEMTNREIRTIAPAELNSVLRSLFALSDVKTEKIMNPRCLVSSIERDLKKNDYPVSIINDKQFELTRKSLQSKEKGLKKAGCGNKDKAAVVLIEEEIDVLYENNMLGVSSAECVVVRSTGICAGVPSVKLSKDAKGNEYLLYTARQIKTRSGVDASNVRKFRQKCSQLTLNEIPWPCTKFTATNDRKI